jgi:hypothetical protein
MADDHLRGLQLLGVLLAVGLAYGGADMAERGYTGDAVASGIGAAVMAACIVGLGRARARNKRLTTKDVITGVIRRRIRVETQYNVRHYLDVGGVEIAVPAAVYDGAREGRTVRVERLSGSRQFLLIQQAGGLGPDAEPGAAADRGAQSDSQ